MSLKDPYILLSIIFKAHLSWWRWEIGNDSGTGKVGKNLNVVRNLWDVCVSPELPRPLLWGLEPARHRAGGLTSAERLLELVSLTCFQTFQQGQPEPSYRQRGDSETTNVVLWLFVWEPLGLRPSCFPGSWTPTRPLRRFRVEEQAVTWAYAVPWARAFSYRIQSNPNPRWRSSVSVVIV